MAGEKFYLTVPPDSTGKSVGMSHTLQIFYSGKSATTEALNYSIDVGEDYPIQDFGVVHVHAWQAFTNDTGVIVGHTTRSDRWAGNLPVVGKNIYNEEQTITLGQVTSVKEIYYPENTIVGFDNNAYGWNIDRFGSGQITFSEGPPEIAGFNQLRVTDQQILAQYDFSRSALADEFANSLEGTGSVSWDVTRGGVRLRAEALGDRSTYTSNMFHPYVPGSGTLFIFAARLSNGGTAGDGAIRNWGAFDASDGFFFKLKEDTLYVTHRYTLAGAATVDHDMSQSIWNRDKLNGAGGEDNPSGMQIDVTKINTYWVDFQFTGGGRTRWGVFYNGERIVCHEMLHGNGEAGQVSSTNPISNPNRPLCWAVANPTPLAGPGDTQDIWAHGGGVYLEATADVLAEANIRNYYNDSFILDKNSTSTTYAFTLSPQQYLPWAPTTENHSLYAPQKLDVTAHPSHPVITSISSDGNNTITVTTADLHYATAGDRVGIHSTTAFNGMWVVSSVTNNTTFVITDTQAGTIGTTTETAGMLMDHTESEPGMVEVRLFQKCIMRGLYYQPVSYSTVDSDIHGDHLAHGPEFARFHVHNYKEFDFTDIFKTIQNGAVKNGSDQSFARSKQSLDSIVGNNVKYSGTGYTPPSRIKIDVGAHPIFGTGVHFFDDKGKVIFRSSTGTTTLTGFTGTTNLSTTDGVWHYLSFIDRDEAWLYNSEADIDDDRDPRLVVLDNSTNVSVGDVITFGSFHATITGIDVDKGTNGSQHTAIANAFLVELRDGDFDSYTGAWSTDGGGSGSSVTVYDRAARTASGLWSQWDMDDDRDCYPLDYKTSLLALDSSTWTDPADSVSSQNVLYGPPPPRAAWTFMVRHLMRRQHDTNVRWAMGWKERIQ